MKTPPRVLGFDAPFIKASRLVCLVSAAAAILALGCGFAAEPVAVGVARVDITPELPIQLAGYQSRTTEATRVAAPLTARALAIGSDAEGPVVLITADVIAIDERMTEAVAAAIRARHPIPRERVAVCATHLHTGPAIARTIPFMFSRDLPADATARIERYADLVQRRLIEVALAALADRKPARLAWAQGQVEFAVNRRLITNGKHTGFKTTPGGPVDHALPVLRAVDERGGVRALLVNYACHCTTLRGGDNFVHPDWAGEAATRIEAAHAGAVALVAIGCGADADPQGRGLPGVASQGATIADEVARLLAGEMRPVGAVTSARFRRIELPLARVVPREELEARLKGRPNVAYAAAQHLRTLDAGKPLPASVGYPVQAWAFGSEFAMVFLGGEVVAEYALRLKRELGAARLWVNAYANHVPCYIPSRQVLSEGGYEAEGAMDYYGFPTRLADDTEDRIVRTVHELLPAAFAKSPAR
ncbi:MAG: neutral/alkaline non-lysosomal ceramidase N-terminal domain-containing protein [Opitutaceae bacterium]|nr:neutral/alkaline non-lysosomal ceramidase N-terminal domain-containing protein [Opitutaceae bacterium]